MGSRAELQKCKSAKSSGWMVMPKKQSAACIIRLLGQPVLYNAADNDMQLDFVQSKKDQLKGSLKDYEFNPFLCQLGPILYCGVVHTLTMAWVTKVGEQRPHSPTLPNFGRITP